jgi:hypothetical protein
MNFKSQYDIGTPNFKKLLEEKEYIKQKLLQEIDYDREVLLEEMEFLNKDSNSFKVNNK